MRERDGISVSGLGGSTQRGGSEATAQASRPSLRVQVELREALGGETRDAVFEQRRRGGRRRSEAMTSGSGPQVSFLGPGSNPSAFHSAPGHRGFEQRRQRAGMRRVRQILQHREKLAFSAAGEHRREIGLPRRAAPRGTICGLAVSSRDDGGERVFMTEKSNPGKGFKSKVTARIAYPMRRT